jgi:hypothetical protein
MEPQAVARRLQRVKQQDKNAYLERGGSIAGGLCRESLLQRKTAHSEKTPSDALPMMARSKLVNLRKMKIGQTDKGK